MCTNYSFLWEHLEPSQLLPILVEKLFMTETNKKEVELYAQKFAQNAVIIFWLFASDCPPLKLCDTLEVTGQEHIARKLLQGTHCAPTTTVFYLLCTLVGFALALEDINLLLNTITSSYLKAHKIIDVETHTYAYTQSLISICLSIIILVSETWMTLSQVLPY